MFKPGQIYIKKDSSLTEFPDKLELIESCNDKYPHISHSSSSTTWFFKSITPKNYQSIITESILINCYELVFTGRD